MRVQYFITASTGLFRRRRCPSGHDRPRVGIAAASRSRLPLEGRARWMDELARAPSLSGGQAPARGVAQVGRRSAQALRQTPAVRGGMGYLAGAKGSKCGLPIGDSNNFACLAFDGQANTVVTPSTTSVKQTQRLVLIVEML